MDQSARPEVAARKKNKKNATGVPSALQEMAAEAKKKKTATGCPSGTPVTREIKH
jgi:hypothetical protein